MLKLDIRVCWRLAGIGRRYLLECVSGGLVFGVGLVFGDDVLAAGFVEVLGECLLQLRDLHG